MAYRSDTVAAERLAGELASGEAQCVAAQADVSNSDDIDRLVATTVERFGKVDVLVNCAAIAPYRPLGQLDAQFIRSMFDTNVTGLMLLIQASVPYMPVTGGRIINFSSALAFRPIPTSSVYAASKGAVITLTHALAKELGSKGITVNAVAPGVIETEMTTNILAERGSQILAATPLARIGQPDDIAGIVMFLASADAGWITGRTIIADGGVT